MGSLLGAPRTLQALAVDRVLPTFLGRGFGQFKDPRFATVFSFLIALAGILLGGLNVIAPILSMFFLTSYGVLNLSAGMEALISNPAWRPRFRVPAWLPLTGAFACLGVMLMIAPGATMIAIVTCAAIYYLMKRRTLRAHWGDMRLGFMMFMTRMLLYRMAGMRLDERTWKPNLLVLSGSPSQRWHLIELADAIAQSRSLVTVAAFIPEENWTTARVDQITDAIRAYLTKRSVPAFIRALPAADPYAGAAVMIRSYGFGPITPNTVLIGETENPSNFVRFAELIQLIARTEKNLIVVRQRANRAGGEAPTANRKKHIDLWWSDKSPQPAFMLAVAVLLLRSEHWSGARRHFKTIVDSEAAKENAVRRWQEFMTKARIDAVPEVLVRNHEPVFDLIKRTSQHADLVVLGLRAPADDETAEAYSKYYEELLRQTEAFTTTRS
jgi:hypothetical protein